jgi:adenosylmethionine---8-amino-7-oxononanoate aminotransferase
MTISPVWHPFTQHALSGPMTAVASASGAYLHTADGRRIIDAISSWWVITHGHCHPRIVEAIKAQAERLDQVIFAGHTHEPAETLARRLLEIAPPGLSHVFFSDSGSTSVEVALKMALGFWRNSGEPRRRIAVLQHAYHGDTVGAMSMGERGVFNAAYEPLLFSVERVPFPAPGSEQTTIDAVERLFRTEPTAAFVAEPLVLGAGGMLMYPASILKELRRLCQHHRVLFIADEVMTGFGRTGRLFACDHAGITPDILCLAKGITGGTLPLAATLCRPEIFAAHYSKDRARTFFHSSSYTANPIACAAACANLDVWEREPVMARLEAIERAHRSRLQRLAGNPRLRNARQIGTIAAVDVDVHDAGYLADISLRLYEFFQSRGVLLRPLGNTVYVLPPYCINESDLDLVYAAISDAVSKVAA